MINLYTIVKTIIIIISLTSLIATHALFREEERKGSGTHALHAYALA